jgi:hypothetical protein
MGTIDHTPPGFLQAFTGAGTITPISWHPLRGKIDYAALRILHAYHLSVIGYFKIIKMMTMCSPLSKYSKSRTLNSAKTLKLLVIENLEFNPNYGT